MRVSGTGAIEKPEFEEAESRIHEAGSVGEKASPTGGALKLFERDALRPGACFSGEALVFQMDSTTYVPAGWNARVDGYLNLLLERE